MRENLGDFIKNTFNMLINKFFQTNYDDRYDYNLHLIPA